MTGATAVSVMLGICITAVHPGSGKIRLQLSASSVYSITYHAFCFHLVGQIFSRKLQPGVMHITQHLVVVALFSLYCSTLESTATHERVDNRRQIRSDIFSEKELCVLDTFDAHFEGESSPFITEYNVSLLQGPKLHLLLIT